MPTGSVLEDARAVHHDSKLSNGATFTVRRAAVALRSFNLRPQSAGGGNQHANSHRRASSVLDSFVQTKECGRTCQALGRGVVTRASSGQHPPPRDPERSASKPQADVADVDGLSSWSALGRAQVPIGAAPGISKPGLKQLPDRWTLFLEALLRKDYAVGYLLLLYLGQSTLVLSTLMASYINTGLSPLALQDEPSAGPPTSPGAAPASARGLPGAENASLGSGPSDDLRISGMLSLLQGAARSAPASSRHSLTISGLLASQGKMSVADVTFVTKLLSERELMQVLRRASAGPDPTPEAAAAAATSVDLSPPASSDPRPHAAAAASGAANATVDAPGRDDIPMYSRVTDDQIIGMGLASLPPPAFGSGWPFGYGSSGGSGGSGGRPGGRSGGTDDNGGPDWQPAWSSLCQCLLEALPMALAVSLALPPAALHRFVTSLLHGRVVAAGPAAALCPPAAQLSRSTRVPVLANTIGDATADHVPEQGYWEGDGEPVLGLDPEAVDALLAAWPAAWLPHDGVGVLLSISAASDSEADPGAWLRSAAGRPLPASDLSAVRWLSELGASPQLLAGRVTELVLEARESRAREAATAAHVLAAAAVSKVLLQSQLEEQQEMHRLELLQLREELQQARDRTDAAAVHTVVAVAVVKACAAADGMAAAEPFKEPSEAPCVASLTALVSSQALAIDQGLAREAALVSRYVAELASSRVVSNDIAAALAAAHSRATAAATEAGQLAQLAANAEDSADRERLLKAELASAAGGLSAYRSQVDALSERVQQVEADAGTDSTVSRDALLASLAQENAIASLKAEVLSLSLQLQAATAAAQQHQSRATELLQQLQLAGSASAAAAQLAAGRDSAAFLACDAAERREAALVAAAREAAGREQVFLAELSSVSVALEAAALSNSRLIEELSTSSAGLSELRASAAAAVLERDAAAGRELDLAAELRLKVQALETAALSEARLVEELSTSSACLSAMQGQVASTPTHCDVEAAGEATLIAELCMKERALEAAAQSEARLSEQLSTATAVLSELTAKVAAAVAERKLAAGREAALTAKLCSKDEALAAAALSEACLREELCTSAGGQSAMLAQVAAAILECEAAATREAALAAELCFKAEALEAAGLSEARLSEGLSTSAAMLSVLKAEAAAAIMEREAAGRQEAALAAELCSKERALEASALSEARLGDELSTSRAGLSTLKAEAAAAIMEREAAGRQEAALAAELCSKERALEASALSEARLGDELSTSRAGLSTLKAEAAAAIMEREAAAGREAALVAELSLKEKALAAAALSKVCLSEELMTSSAALSLLEAEVAAVRIEREAAAGREAALAAELSLREQALGELSEELSTSRAFLSELREQDAATKLFCAEFASMASQLQVAMAQLEALPPSLAAEPADAWAAVGPVGAWEAAAGSAGAVATGGAAAGGPVGGGEAAAGAAGAGGAAAAGEALAGCSAAGARGLAGATAWDLIRDLFLANAQSGERLLRRECQSESVGRCARELATSLQSLQQYQEAAAAREGEVRRCSMEVTEVWFNAQLLGSFSRVQTLDADVDTRQCNLEVAQAHCSQLNVALEVAQAQNSELNAEVICLASELSMLRGVHASAQAECNLLNASACSLTDELSIMRGMHSSAQAQNSELNASASSCTDELSMLRGMHVSTQAQNSELNAKASSHTDELSMLRGLHASALDKQRALEGQLAELRSEHERLLGTLSRAEASGADADAKLAALDASMASLQPRLAQLELESVQHVADARHDRTSAALADSAYIKLLVKDALGKAALNAQVEELRDSLMQLTTGFETYVLGGCGSFDSAAASPEGRPVLDAFRTSQDGPPERLPSEVLGLDENEDVFSTPLPPANQPSSRPTSLADSPDPVIFDDRQELVAALINQVSGMQVQLSALQFDIVTKQEALAAGPTPMELAELAALSGGRLTAWGSRRGLVATPKGSRLGVRSSKDATPGGPDERDSPGGGLTTWPDVSYLFSLADTAILTAMAEGASSQAVAQHRTAHSPFEFESTQRFEFDSAQPFESPTKTTTPIKGIPSSLSLTAGWQVRSPLRSALRSLHASRMQAGDSMHSPQTTWIPAGDGVCSPQASWMQPGGSMQSPQMSQEVPNGENMRSPQLSRMPAGDAHLRSPHGEGVHSTQTSRVLSEDAGSRSPHLSRLWMQASVHEERNAYPSPSNRGACPSPSKPMLERVEHMQTCMDSMRAVLDEARGQLDLAQPESPLRSQGMDQDPDRSQGIGSEDPDSSLSVGSEDLNISQGVGSKDLYSSSGHEDPDSSPGVDEEAEETQEVRNSVNPLYIPCCTPPAVHPLRYIGGSLGSVMVPKPTGPSESFLQPCRPRQETLDSVDLLDDATAQQQQPRRSRPETFEGSDQSLNVAARYVHPQLQHAPSAWATGPSHGSVDVMPSLCTRRASSPVAADRSSVTSSKKASAAGVPQHTAARAGARALPPAASTFPAKVTDDVLMQPLHKLVSGPAGPPADAPLSSSASTAAGSRYQPRHPLAPIRSSERTPSVGRSGPLRNFVGGSGRWSSGGGGGGSTLDGGGGSGSGRGRGGQKLRSSAELQPRPRSSLELPGAPGSLAAQTLLASRAAPAPHAAQLARTSSGPLVAKAIASLSASAYASATRGSRGGDPSGSGSGSLGSEELSAHTAEVSDAKAAAADAVLAAASGAVGDRVVAAAVEAAEDVEGASTCHVAVHARAMAVHARAMAGSNSATIAPRIRVCEIQPDAGSLVTELCQPHLRRFEKADGRQAYASVDQLPLGSSEREPDRMHAERASAQLPPRWQARPAAAEEGKGSGGTGDKTEGAGPSLGRKSWRRVGTDASEDGSCAALNGGGSLDEMGGGDGSMTAGQWTSGRFDDMAPSDLGPLELRIASMVTGRPPIGHGDGKGGMQRSLGQRIKSKISKMLGSGVMWDVGSGNAEF